MPPTAKLPGLDLLEPMTPSTPSVPAVVPDQPRFSIVRIYKSDGGWKQSNFFGSLELAAIAELAGQAKAWIEAQEAKQ